MKKTNRKKTDFSGNYYSTYDFVGTHKLNKEAEEIFGKNWEAEDDLSQIEDIIISLIPKNPYIVTIAQDRREWNEIMQGHDLAHPTSDHNYDIFVIENKNSYQFE